MQQGKHGSSIWKTDGTAAGTAFVASVDFPHYLTNANGTLLFSAKDANNGIELWKSDGTAAGTGLLKDLRSGIFDSNPKNFTNVNGTLFFTANDGTHGNVLWKTDGTGTGTIMAVAECAKEIRRFPYEGPLPDDNAVPSP